MTSSKNREPAATRLRKAIVLSTTEQTCTVFAEGRQRVVAYAQCFPVPRLERVIPGHLVAIATAADGSEVVIWRWFDAVVVGQAGSLVRLWEPAHDVVVARPRDPRRVPRPGGRAYLSAGLPGAEWWVAGPAISIAEDADIELLEVERFFTSHDLWNNLT
jgi:hypothetical protein